MSAAITFPEPHKGDPIHLMLRLHRFGVKEALTLALQAREDNPLLSIAYFVIACADVKAILGSHPDAVYPHTDEIVRVQIHGGNLIWKDKFDDALRPLVDRWLDEMCADGFLMEPRPTTTPDNFWVEFSTGTFETLRGINMLLEQKL